VDKGKFTFTVNCRKAPLRMGDQFGPFTVVGFETNKKDSTCMSGRTAALGQSEPEWISSSSNNNGNSAADASSTGNAGSNADADTQLMVGIVVGTVALVLIVFGAVACRADTTRRAADDAFNGVLEPENTETESVPSLDDDGTQLNQVMNN